MNSLDPELNDLLDVNDSVKPAAAHGRGVGQMWLRAPAKNSVELSIRELRYTEPNLRPCPVSFREPDGTVVLDGNGQPSPETADPMHPDMVQIRKDTSDLFTEHEAVA